MNYGESLGYWYLRLNGFIPMANFVLHGGGKNGQTTDADILAVRFPHVFEIVGGRNLDWDNLRFGQWEADYQHRTICLLCEVKAGGYKVSEVNKAFNSPKLASVLARFGIVPLDQVTNVVRMWLRANVARIPESSVTVIKLLIDDERKRPGPDAEDGLPLRPCCRLSLQDARKFIQKRMRDYKHKYAGRMFFPGDLIQFLAWDSGVDVVVNEDDADEVAE